MASTLHFNAPRPTAKRLMLALALCTVGVGGVYLLANRTAFGDHRSDGPAHGSAASLPSAPAHPAVAASIGMSGSSARPSQAGAEPAEDAPLANFTPAEAAQALRGFIDKVIQRAPLSADDVTELQARLLASIEADPGVIKAVQGFYRDMPADQPMERDMLRTLLVRSAAGREIVLEEANAIWNSQAADKFAEMYETYFNLPGKATSEVFAQALGDLRKGAAVDQRTAIARLNFIGLLEVPNMADGMSMRSDAIELLNRTAAAQGDEAVRALAVQKLFRLSSPAEAANIAVAQLSHGAYADLMRETLGAVGSGDVELTPNLKTALTSAVNRTGVTPEEKKMFDEVVRGHR